MKKGQMSNNNSISSILTGVPIQTRIGGMITVAGCQQLLWCNQILKDMGKKKGMKVKIMWGEQYMTREEVKEHKASI